MRLRSLTLIITSICITVMTFKISVCAKTIKIEKVNAKYQLFVDGEIFDIKGAGVNYPDGHNFQALKNAGGNSFRTWSTTFADIELEKAKELGLMVMVGIDLKKQLHGFDYNDEKAVKAQFESVKQQVLKYKDHPNLLGWMVANEPNLLMADDGSLAMVNPKVYQAISDIIDFIHAVDPHHPVSFSFAGVIPEHIQTALKYTPQVDFISVQVYGDLVDLQQRITALDIDKPFMVTEFGPLGHWERPSTSWGREIEEPSGIKAKSFSHRIHQGIANNSSGKLIGHFAFEWGQKQERTPTWYGMFNKDGKTTEQIDELTKFWTGQYPENRAPSVQSFLVNKVAAENSLILNPSSTAIADVFFSEPDLEQTNIRWQLMKEVSTKSQGGAFEQEPEVVDLVVTQQSLGENKKLQTLTAEFIVPDKTGEYRLFVYIDDGKEKVGYANFPFYVDAN